MKNVYRIVVFFLLLMFILSDYQINAQTIYSSIVRNNCGPKSSFADNTFGTITYNVRTDYIRALSSDFQSYYSNVSNNWCNYTIDADKEESTIRLTLLDFSLRARAGTIMSCIDNATDQWLTVGCLDDEEIKNHPRYCGLVGQTMPRSINFTNCSTLRISVYSDNKSPTMMHTYSSIRIFFAITPNSVCGKSDFTKETGLIVSPFGGVNVYSPDRAMPYPKNISCRYTVFASQPSTISLAFLSFDLEQPIEGCPYDGLEIGCSSDELKMNESRRYCGSMIPQPLTFENCSKVQLIFNSDHSGAGDGFRIRYIVTTNESVCGVTEFTHSTGVVTSPSTYPNYLHCTYTIIPATQTSTIYLQFLAIKMYGPGYTYSHYRQSCSDDWLMIRCMWDGMDEINPKLNSKYCGLSGNTPQKLTFSNCERLMLIFNTNQIFNGTGFRINYTVSANESQWRCGDTLFTNSTGIITSPADYLRNPHGVYCTYKISASEPSRISLKFQLLMLEYSVSCTHDWVMIGCLRNDTTELDLRLSEKYCGSRHPQNKTTYFNCSTVMVVFRTDHTETVYSSGFRMAYEISSVIEPRWSCGHDLFTDATGEIVSPKTDSGRYPNGVDCNYTISTTEPSKFYLQFLSFDIEVYSRTHNFYFPGSECFGDWLTISCLKNETFQTDRYSNYPQKYCGAGPTVLILTNCLSILLQFHTDDSFVGDGFRINYTMVSNKANSTCDNTLFTNTSGVITSPRTDSGRYPHGINCNYTILSTEPSTISLFIVSMDIERRHLPSIGLSYDECPHDWLTIECTLGRRMTPTQKYCGKRYGHGSMNFQNCSALTLGFVTDGLIDGEGFRINYTVLENSKRCGKTFFPEVSGIISFPSELLKYLQINPDCKYTISATQTSRISLQFLSINIYSPHGGNNCYYNWLMIGCLSNGTDELISSSSSKYCGSITPRPVSFLCSRVRLNFHEDYFYKWKEFQIKYTVVELSWTCGNTLFTNTTGIITSPKVGSERYPHRVNCNYTISATESSMISLKFLWFDVEGSHFKPCTEDWLMIGCLSDEMTQLNSLEHHKYCGQVTPRSLTFSNCSKIMLIFSSNSSIVREGFRISYAVSTNESSVGTSYCGRTLFSDISGILTSPNDFRDFTECHYKIVARQPNVLSLHVKFDLTDYRTCLHNWIMIGCSMDRIYCGMGDIYLTFFNCSAVNVVYYSDLGLISGSFQVTYAVQNESEFSSGGPTRPSVPTPTDCPVGCFSHAMNPYISLDKKIWCMCTAKPTTPMPTTLSAGVITKQYLSGADLVPGSASYNGTNVKSFPNWASVLITLVCLVAFVGVAFVGIRWWHWKHRGTMDNERLLQDQNHNNNTLDRSGEPVTLSSAAANANIYVPLEPMIIKEEKSIRFSDLRDELLPLSK